MPQNKIGQAIGTHDYLRADGYSPGNMIIVKVPAVQTQAAFNNSGIVPITNLRAYDDDNQPVVVINAETGERHPIWAEVDANPHVPGKSGNPANSNLIIRPARNFDEGARYIVAIRNLRDAQSNPVEPPMPFRVYRDRLITQQAPGREPPAAHREPDLDAAAERLPALEPVHDLGLHRGQRGQPHRPRAGDAGRRAAAPGRYDAW